MQKTRLALCQELKSHLESRTGIKWEISPQIKQLSKTPDEKISDLLPHGKKFHDLFIKVLCIERFNFNYGSLFLNELKKAWIPTAEMAEIYSKEKKDRSSSITPLLFVSTKHFSTIMAISNSMELLTDIKANGGIYMDLLYEQGNETNLLAHVKIFSEMNYH